MTGPRIGPTIRERVIAVLRRASTPRTTAEIAAAIGRQPGGIATAVARLERDGVIANDEAAQAASAHRGRKYWRLVGEADG